MNRRQKIVLSVTGIFLVLLLLVGLTYAYFLTRINGNENTKSISVSTANLALVYGDDDGSVIGEGETIEPGTTFETKTFTVTNQGNANTDYVVVIENTSVTYATTVEVDGETHTAGETTTFESNDFTYTLICESGCNGTVEPTTFPIEGGILVGNRIDVGETQTYSFTLTYNETGLDQSNDMNKKLEAKINIKDITTINPYSDKPNTLAYNIINNAVALTNEEKTLGYAELVGSPYSKVAAEKPETKTVTGHELDEDIESTIPVAAQTNVYITYATSYTVDSETGKFSLVNPQSCKYSESNCVSDLVAAGENIYITNGGLSGNFSGDGSLVTYENLEYVYRLVSAPAASDADITIKTRRITNMPESVISTTQDEYGTSYYYRGAVENNYVNFNRMCWRIVRIEGDGSVRLILADKDAECSEETLSKTDSSIIGEGMIHYLYDTQYRGQFSYDYIGQPVYEEWSGNTYEPYDMGAFGQSMMHIKKAYEVFLNGGTIEYTEDGSYKGDGTDVVITKTYGGFSEESLELLKAKKVCIGESNTTYTKYDNATFYHSPTFKRLYEDKYATLLCNGGDYTEESKVFPLTIDEAVLAGGIVDQLGTAITYNYNPYLSENAMTDWWLLSYSGDMNETPSSPMFYFSFADYYINVQQPYQNFKGIRPVISLIPNVELTSGDGSIGNPYVIG